jgi:DNA sulfur modification protein DndD
MKLKRLKINNFMPYKGMQQISFPTGSENVCVVYGDNMRGKTSFLNAIRFAFFGRATARHLRDIDPINLFNIEATEEGDWSLGVTVHFEHDSIDYEVRRELTALEHVARPQTKEDLKESFFVRKGGVPLAGQDISFEMNQVLPEGISRFFLFDGELLQEYEELVLNPSNASKIKDSIEAILGVPALTTGLREIQSLLAQAQTAQAQDLKHSKKLQAQAERQLSIQKEIDSLKAQIETKVEEKRGFDTRAEELQQRLEQFSQALDFEKELIKTQSEISAEKSAISEKRSHRADLLQEGWVTLLQPRLALKRKDLNEDRTSLLASFADNARMRREASELKAAIVKGVCQTCESDLKGTHAEVVGKKLGAIEGKLDFLDDKTEEFSRVQGQLDAITRIQSSPLAERVMSVERQMRASQVKLSEHTAKEKDLTKKLAEFSGRDAERIRSEREQVRTVAASLSREIDDLRTSLQEQQRKLDQTSRLMSRNPATRTQKSSRLVSLYSSLEEVFEQAVDRLRDKQRSRVQDYASDAFRNLTSEPEYAGLEINENYGLTIVDQKNRSVEERSAGAEQIVALSLIDGLNRAGRRGGPIVMDTPFGRLDWTHRANVLKFLPEMAEQVILLVHEGELDPQRDLPILGPYVGAMYKINRIGARHSKIELESEPSQ